MECLDRPVCICKRSLFTKKHKSPCPESVSFDGSEHRHHPFAPPLLTDPDVLATAKHEVDSVSDSSFNPEYDRAVSLSISFLKMIKKHVQFVLASETLQS